MALVPLHKFCLYLVIVINLLHLCTGIKVGVCDICLASNNVACLDENHFTICYNGLPTGIITPCPPSSVCVNDRQICRSANEGFTPICYEENCGNCQASNAAYTCLDQTSYTQCDGPFTSSSGVISSCAEGFVCNTYSTDICVPATSNRPTCLAKPCPTTTTPEPTTADPTTTDTTSPTTDSSVTTPTLPECCTTEAPRDANAICGKIGKFGYYPSGDPTCREYVYCYPLSGQYLGWTYFCDGYFNAETNKCQTERPADCKQQ